MTLFRKAVAAISVTAACLGALPGHAIAANERVRLILNIPYEPFEFRNKDGELAGFDIDLGNAMCAQAKLSCSWSEQGWESLLPSLMTRKADAIMSGMTISDDRREQVLFSDPYLIQPSGWFAPVDSPLSNVTTDTLRHQRIGVQRGSSQDRYATDLYGQHNDIRRYASADDAVNDLMASRLDITLFDYPTGQSALLEASPGRFRLVGAKIQDERYFNDGFGIAFRKRDQALAERFNRALAELKENGTYQKLVDKYFPETPQ
ncbi:transporter substrate-binding domain-containing protein [Zymobacter palmae]|uniref:ABC-type amino acid transport/signal n=1 Tax=Zymobacter palmae TaxID=33074 RepID=A0A348HG07_9GAMM|nr:transporter substrate-binding domain-containing protein [Zymobacter palmae]BBG30559.1 ABC-type amino acid transport/signal [Zymobacter palmae]